MAKALIVVTVLAVSMACGGTRGDAGGEGNVSARAGQEGSGKVTERSEIATLGGGCFWCMEAVFDRVEGVEEVVVGYAGGTAKDPTYALVGSGRTGHAEVVQVRFDPAVLSFHDLLEIFFAMHDPTTRDRQGADVGSQYRSLVLYHSAAQKKEVEAVIRDLERRKVFPAPIVTEVAPFETFYPAEESHQDYYARNPQQGYCRVVISPKVNKLRKIYTQRLKSEYR